jgi:hypothetical protein
MYITLQSTEEYYATHAISSNDVYFKKVNDFHETSTTTLSDELQKPRTSFGIPITIYDGDSKIFHPNAEQISHQVRDYLEKAGLDSKDLEVTGITLHLYMPMCLKPSKYILGVTGLRRVNTSGNDIFENTFNLFDPNDFMGARDYLRFNSSNALGLVHNSPCDEEKLGFKVGVEQLLQKTFWKHFIQNSIDEFIMREVSNEIRCRPLTEIVPNPLRGLSKSYLMKEELFDKVLLASQRWIYSL